MWIYLKAPRITCISPVYTRIRIHARIYTYHFRPEPVYAKPDSHGHDSGVFRIFPAKIIRSGDSAGAFESFGPRASGARRAIDRGRRKSLPPFGWKRFPGFFGTERERGKFPQETDIKRVRGGQKYMRCDAMMRRRDVPRARRAGGLLLLCRDLEMGPDLGLFMLSLSLSLSPSLRRQRAPRPCLGRHRTRA